MDKKEAIQKATLELITTHGFHGTSMSMIWKKAGVAAGTIYHYFDSKETMIRQLYGTLKEKMGHAMLAQDDSSKSYDQRFKAFWKGLYNYFVSNPQEFFFLEQYGNSSFIDDQTREDNLKFYKPVIEFLEEGINKGIIKDMPVEMVTALVYGSVVSTARLQLSGEFKMNDKLVILVIETMLAGLSKSS